jgi:COMPASS component SWD2
VPLSRHTVRATFLQKAVMLKITKDVLASMAMGRVFQGNLSRINSMDFYKDGETLISANNDGCVQIYNTFEASITRKLYCKEYGVDLVRFTHHQNAVLCASNQAYRGTDTIRYWSLHDNCYLNFFVGHTDKVVSLAMSPVNDTFVSASDDGSVRLWDLKAGLCTGVLKRRGSPRAAYDPQGLIFAAFFPNNLIKLFDLRQLDKGPFSTFVIPSESPTQVTHIKFSNDGSFILLATNENILYLLDAYDGHLVCYYTTIKNENKSSLEPTFTPDSKFIVAGSEDGMIRVYSIPDANERQNRLTVNASVCNTLEGQHKTHEVAVWGTEESKHSGPVNCVLVRFALPSFLLPLQ